MSVLLLAFLLQNPPEADATGRVFVRATSGGGGVFGIGGLKYKDVMGSSAGLGLEYDLTWRAMRLAGFGAYARVDLDRWEGGSDIDGLFGISADADPSASMRLILGAKARQVLGPGWNLEERLGVGLISWSTVEGTRNDTGESVEFFADSTRFAMDLELSLHADVSPGIECFLGVPLEINDGPEKGDELFHYVLDASGRTHAMITVGVNIGIGFSF